MSVACRLLIAGGGAGAFAPPDPVPFALTAAPDGAWTQASDPKAVYYNGSTFFGYVDASGNIEVRSYDHATEVVSAAVVLSAAFEYDNHAAPSLLIRDSDKRLLVFYSRHTDTTIRLHISTNSLTTDPTMAGGFGTEASLDAQLGGAVYTYPIALQLLGETNDPIYLFYRDIGAPTDTAYLCYSTSIDGGVTWAAQTAVFARADYRSYWFVHTDGDTRIDLVTTDGATLSDESPVSVYHGYYEGGAWFKTDGSAAGSVILERTDLTLVYDGTTLDAWAHTLARDADGHPVTVLATGDGADTSFLYARWDGAAWVVTAIATTVAVTVTAVVDPADVSLVYAPAKVGSFYEMYEYRTLDEGATWTPRVITSGSSVDNLYPTMVREPGSGLRLLWLAGTYTGQSDYSLGIMGVG